MKKLALCCLATALCALAAPSAQARFVFTVSQVGSNVVISGSGMFNLAGLSLGSNTATANAQIGAAAANLLVGLAPGDSNVTTYGSVSGPAAFGNGGNFLPSTGSGSFVGVYGTAAVLLLPRGYATNTALATSMTFANQTIAGLGITPGTYTYTWGSGANADSLVVTTATAAVPEPSTWALLGIGLVGAGVLALRRRRAVRG